MEQKLTDKEIRHRLISRGAKSLSDSELLSILISGEHGARSVDIADALLREFNGELGDIASAEISKLRVSGGLGIKGAATLSSAIELGRRVAESKAANKLVVRSIEDVVEIFTPMIASLSHEEMWVIYLSSGNTILDKVRISQGGHTATIVDTKLIIKRGIELLATGIILVHNHPSDSLQPSSEDFIQTIRVRDAAALFEIKLLDHIIVSRGGWYSFFAQGKL